MEPSRSTPPAKLTPPIREESADFRTVVLTTADRRSAVVRLQGELDLAAWNRFDSALSHATGDEVRTLVFELRDLTFVDVRTVERWLLTARTMSDRGGQLVLRHARPAVRDLVHRLRAGEPIVVEPGRPGTTRIETATSGYPS